MAIKWELTLQASSKVGHYSGKFMKWTCALSPVQSFGSRTLQSQKRGRGGYGKGHFLPKSKAGDFPVLVKLLSVCPPILFTTKKLHYSMSMPGFSPKFD